MTLKAIKCVFVGYSPTQKGYKCYNPNFRKFLVSCDVSFSNVNHFILMPLFRGRQLLKTAMGYLCRTSYFPTTPHAIKSSEPSQKGIQGEKIIYQKKYKKRYWFVPEGLRNLNNANYWIRSRVIRNMLIMWPQLMTWRFQLL